jgi:hypothetical protein
VSERAEIVTEIKSHILSAQERDPSAPLDTVLSALGPAEVVANRYLLERGQAPTKPPISPLVKWLVIGGLGSMALFTILLVSFLWMLSPIIKVDEEKGQVKILGGMIDIDESKGRIRIGTEKLNKFSGKTTDSLRKGEKVMVRFTNADLTLRPSQTRILAWDCVAHGEAVLPRREAEGLTLDFRDIEDLKCGLRVPHGVALEVVGVNGQLKVEKPSYSLRAEIVNGQIEIDPDAGLKYEYDLKVTNGTVGAFDSTVGSENKISIDLTNGVIERD